MKPSVSIVVVNYNGAHHLPACLDSLAALDYPRERYEVIVVDNGSTDGSLDLVRDRYPWVRLLAQDENLGFAEGNNLAARSSTAEVIALLNNDMAAEQEWLSELVRAYDPTAGYRCVAGVILDWSGERLDFADGVLNYYGMGEQVGFGLPLEDVHVPESRELLFACGGAMLIERKTYLDLGGFSPEYFAYFEDVDFGWRLWLAGHRVRLAPGSRTRHRHHGTSGGMPSHQRRVLYERNALRTLIKNLSEENLWPLLSAALLLLVERARISMGTDRDDYELGAGSGSETETVAREGVAALHSVGDVIDGLPDLMEERRRIQATRRRGDDEIFPLFRRPFLPLASADTAFVDAMAKVTHELGLERLFEQRRATRVLVVAYDAIAPRMAGPAVRCWEISRALARSVAVTLATSTPISLTAPNVEIVTYRDDDELAALAVEADVILLHGHALEQYPSLRRARALKVVDLYDPWLFENLEYQQALAASEGDWIVARDVDVQRELLAAGDFFVCASERQRDFWLGMLAAEGRVDRAAYAADPTLRLLIDTVPYGCPETAPAADRRVLRGADPRVPDDAFLLLWGGGTWDWFDPVTVLEAFAGLVEEVPEARLYFMGLELRDRGVPPQRVAAEVRRRAEELGLADRTVLFGDWVPYEERGAYLAEASIGVVAARDVAETRLAFRSRLLDHFWAGLPTVATRGDALSELVEAEGAGVTVAPGDVDALREELLRLARDPSRRTSMSERASALADRFRWSEVVEPLRRVVEEPWRWTALRARRPHEAALTEDAQLLLTRLRHQRLRGGSRHGGPLPARLARRAWWRTPESLRRRLRPGLRAAQRALGQRRNP